MARALTIDSLRSTVSYDPLTGHFTWLVARGKHCAGRRSHNVNGRGYVTLALDGRTYQAHRLAWFYMTGYWAATLIDHIDGDKTNNAWSNLRLATSSQNLANSKTYKNNEAGIKGVRWNKRDKAWQARICVNGRAKSLGYYASSELAKGAYAEAAAKYFGEFARPL